MSSSQTHLILYLFRLPVLQIVVIHQWILRSSPQNSSETSQHNTVSTLGSRFVYISGRSTPPSRARLNAPPPRSTRRHRPLWTERSEPGGTTAQASQIIWWRSGSLGQSPPQASALAMGLRSSALSSGWTGRNGLSSCVASGFICAAWFWIEGFCVLLCVEIWIVDHCVLHEGSDVLFLSSCASPGQPQQLLPQVFTLKVTNNVKKS